MAKKLKQPKMPKLLDSYPIPKPPKPLKVVNGYFKKDGTFVAPHMRDGYKAF